MATKDRNIDKQNAFSVGRLHPPTGYQRGNGGIVSVGNAGVYKAIANSGPTTPAVVSTSGSQAFADPSLAGFGDDYFNGWVLIFEGNCRNTSTIVKGEMNYVVDYDSTNGTFTTSLNDWSATPQAGDEFTLIKMELLPDGMIRATKSITLAASTTGSVATHEVITVTGLCRVKLLVQCSTDLTGAGSAQLGVAGATTALVASTSGTAIDDTELWADATPPSYIFTTDGIFDLITDGIDIGYEVTGATLTAGVLNFIYWWQPLEASATCASAAGTGTL